MGSLRVKTTLVGPDTTFGRIVRMVEEAEANRADLADVVASGREYQEVVVHRVFNYEDGTVFEVRTDTGETLRSRNMTDEERQATLLDDSDAAGN